MASSFYKNRIEAISGASAEFSTYVSADYAYFKPEWELIRDCMAGERRIKEKGTQYLPALGSDLGTSYQDFRDRASFVNMVSRTVTGLVGTVFRRPVKVDNVPREDLKDVTLTGQSFNIFSKVVVQEVASVGRVGVLVDMTDGKRPYMSEYIAENILAWKTAIVNGREVLTYVLLREIVDVTPSLGGGGAQSFYNNSNLFARYRVLLLEDGVYKQRLYDQQDKYGMASSVTYKTITPTKGGKTFDFIPFKIMGPNAPTANVQKSPVFDIAVLNIAHYKASAMLEHGRHFTAFPVYTVTVPPGQERDSYQLGGSCVWELAPESKASILEYFGTGLKGLADSLVEKEEHISQLGGRIMGIRPQASGESDNIFMLKQATEMSILLNITESVSDGMSDVIRWYLDWQRKPIEGVRVRLNQEFKSQNLAGRELRAIALLYQSNMLPVQDLFRIFQDNELLDEELTLEEFIERLNDVLNFPNQPDVAAMHEGYPDAQSRLSDGQKSRVQLSQEREAENKRVHDMRVAERQFGYQKDNEEILATQAERTAAYELENAKELETHKSQLKIKETKAAPKPKPAAAKPAGNLVKKPAVKTGPAKKRQ